MSPLRGPARGAEQVAGRLSVGGKDSVILGKAFRAGCLLQSSCGGVAQHTQGHALCVPHLCILASSGPPPHAHDPSMSCTVRFFWPSALASWLGPGCTESLQQCSTGMCRAAAVQLAGNGCSGGCAKADCFHPGLVAAPG